MRSEWICDEDLGHVLAALLPANRLVLEVCLQTGLRIGDVLAMRTDQLSSRMTIRESKTGKSRRIYIPAALLARLRASAGDVYVFPSQRRPLEASRHRTTVYKDLQRARELFRIPARISPHSARKIYAVRKYHKTGDILSVQACLGHSDLAVTMVYAMADVLTQRRLTGRARPARKRKRKGPGEA